MRIFSIVSLFQVRLSAAVALTAAAGYWLAAGRLSWKMAAVWLGVFLLACGARALNQYQERAADARMRRTRGRPIPSGRLLPATALAIAIGVLVVGAVFLFKFCGASACGLGMVAVAWYSGVYTLLKRKTAFAVFPGAIIGALPPLIGWVTAVDDFVAQAVMSGMNLEIAKKVAPGAMAPGLRLYAALTLFLLLWQILHFSLLQLRDGDDYERAGFPSLKRAFGKRAGAWALVWTLAAIGGGVGLPLGLAGAGAAGAAIALAAAAWLLWRAWPLRGGVAANMERQADKAFRAANIFAGVVCAWVCFERIFL